jgi:molybdate transport system permease protein
MPPARAMFRGIGVQYGTLSAAGGNVIFSGIQRQGNRARRPLTNGAASHDLVPLALVRDGPLLMEWMTLSAEEWVAVRLSLKVASVATLVSLPLAIAVAMALGRYQFWGHALLNGLVLLPLILPPVVTGYLLLLLFGRRGVIGGFLADHLGIVFSFRWTGAALACGVMGFPLLVRALRLSIEAVDPRLEEAAGTLGAHRGWVFLTVTLPLIVPGILAGTILCFAKAMGEFGATITFVSNIPGETQTLPSAIYTFTQVPGGDVGALRLTLVSVAISILALLVSEILARRAQQRLDLQ